MESIMDPETNKFRPVPRSDVEDRPAPAIPSIVRRDANAPKPSGSFTWPLATAKPRDPSPWKPPAPPARSSAPVVKVPAQLARVPKATAPPPVKVEPVVQVEPVREPEPQREPEPAPIAVAPAPIVVAPEPIAVAPEPVVVPPEPVRIEPVREAPVFGSSMLQAKKRSAAIDVPAIDTATASSMTFGSGMLQARKGGNKVLLIAVIGSRRDRWARRRARRLERQAGAGADRAALARPSSGARRA
jgi:hypothetical protein